MSTVLRELSAVPSLHNRWVAIHPRGLLPERLTPLCALKSGAVVIDADLELDALCARLCDRDQTSLTIVFNRHGAKP